MYFPLSKYKKVFITTIVIQSCICVIGCIGNTITCIVIVSDKTMRTTTNIYLFNLAVTDIIMLTVGLEYFTARIWYMSKNELLYGLKTNCFIVSWTVHTSFAVLIMTLMAFTIERYLAICHPFLARRILSISRALKLIFVIWIIGIVLGYFITSYQHLQIIRDKTFCIWDNGTPYVIELESSVFYGLPFVVFLILYIFIGKKLAESSKIRKSQGTQKNLESSEVQIGDHNKKVFKMLMTVVAVFFMSWAPFHIGRLLHLHIDKWLPLASAGPRYRDGYCILIIIHSIGYFISSAINPIIYNAMSNKFRGAFKDLLVKLWYFCLCTKGKAKTKDECKTIETHV